MSASGMEAEDGFGRPFSTTSAQLSPLRRLLLRDAGGFGCDMLRGKADGLHQSSAMDLKVRQAHDLL
jgi:hypothetical protein